MIPCSLRTAGLLLLVAATVFSGCSNWAQRSAPRPEKPAKSGFREWNNHLASGVRKGDAGDEKAAPKSPPTATPSAKSPPEKPPAKFLDRIDGWINSLRDPRSDSISRNLGVED